MGTLELLLAAHVRTIAIELRGTARAAYYSTVFADFDEDQRRIKIAAWDREHPIETFVPIALYEVEDIASMVAKLLDDQAQP